MKVLTAVFLWMVIAFSIVMMWNRSRLSVSIPEMGALALAAILLAACAAGWQRLVLSPVLIPVAAVFLWGLLQLWLGVSVYAWRTKGSVIYWGVNLAVFFSALQAFADKRVRQELLNALLWFASFVAILSWFQSLDAGARVFWILTPDPKYLPQFGPFPYRNQYSAFVELLLPLAIFRAVTEERRRLVFGLMVTVLYGSVIASASRMGFFLATGEMLVVPVLVMSRKGIPFRRLRSTAAFLLVLMAMLAAAAGPATLLQRFDAPDSYAGRREYTDSSLAMIRDRPLLGSGLGTWPSVYPGYALFDEGLYVNQAHDDWAQWGAEGGLPFLAIMLAIAAWSAWRGIKTGWGLGVFAVFVHCFVDYPIQRAGVAMTMFILLAALASEYSETHGPSLPQ